MRTAETIERLIGLYKTEAERLKASVHGNATIGQILAWYSCKVAIADLYEELATLRVGNVERIRPNVDRRRRPRKRVA